MENTIYKKLRHFLVDNDLYIDDIKYIVAVTNDGNKKFPIEYFKEYCNEENYSEYKHNLIFVGDGLCIRSTKQAGFQVHFTPDEPKEELSIAKELLLDCEDSSLMESLGIVIGSDSDRIPRDQNGIRITTRNLF